MHKNIRQSFFALGLLLGIGLPGLMGILVVQAKVVRIEAENPQQALLDALLSPTATRTGAPLPSPTATSSPLATPFTSSGTSGNLYAFIQAPSGVVSRPYVLLTAFGAVARSGAVNIRGFVDSDEFVCAQFPCQVYITGSARFIFRAYSSDTGAASDEVIASVTVTQGVGGFLVSVDSVNQFASFRDSCSALWGVSDEENAKWDNFVQFPYQLNTKKTLHTLATQLIMNGVVDTSGCQFGGLSSSLDWPTACGLEKASNAMISWQNQYDGYIWLASKNRGIPPKVLKTLIEVESQFWPGNSRFYLDEFGLGQVNQLGVDLLLRKDPLLYQQICPTVFSDCNTPYLGLDPAKQRLIRGAVVKSMDAACADCPYGINLDKANQSVDLIARVLGANCQQVNSILGDNVDDATYEDLWRFTLASYHSGISCFSTAVVDTKKDGLRITWENLEKHMKCGGGKDYVNGFMDNLFSFDYYLYEPADVVSVAVGPTIVPTRTPIPTPTVYISSAKIEVQVFLDRNLNGVFDPGEGIDAMSVDVTTSNNKQISQRTKDGLATFDMSGYPPGVAVTVSLPGLYRSESFTLPEVGNIPVVFKFDMPALPTSLP